MTEQGSTTRRTPLNRDRVLKEAVALADEVGIEALSMRKLSQRLQVVPMAIYRHVANKEELLTGMIDVIIGEIDPPLGHEDWKTAVRERILSARRALLRHAWAPAVIESRPSPTGVVLDHIESIIGMFLAGGFSVDLTHHALHALGSRMWGFSQDVFPAPPDSEPELGPEARAVAQAEAEAMAARYPGIAQIAAAAAHDDESIVGGGCDDQFEFEFALDVLLDGFEKLYRQGWGVADRR